MELERRGRVRLSYLLEQLETGCRQRIRQTSRLKSISGECTKHTKRSNPRGCGRRGSADDRAVRSRLGGKPLQDLEQDELGNLLSTAGARRLHSQKERRPADFRCAHRKRSDRADGGQTAYRAGSGSPIPARLLRLQTEEIGPGRGWSHA